VIFTVCAHLVRGPGTLRDLFSSVPHHDIR
jgi:hypothetical protein